MVPSIFTPGERAYRASLWRQAQAIVSASSAFAVLVDGPGLCPLALAPPQDPVRAADGHVYDRVHINQWMAEHTYDSKWLSPRTYVRWTKRWLTSVAPRAPAGQYRLRQFFPR